MYSQQANPANYDPSAGISQLSMSGGYQGGYQIGQATDPFAAGITQDENLASSYANNYNSQLPQMQQNLQAAGQNLQNYQSSVASPSSYPSYQNGAGAGSQMAGVPQTAVSPMMGSGDAGAGTSLSTSDTSTGFNPWSLQGEAMTRK